MVRSVQIQSKRKKAHPEWRGQEMEETFGPGLQSFEGKLHPVPPGTKARPRPKGQERPTPEELGEEDDLSDAEKTPIAEDSSKEIRE
jgi:hypothetical protein